MTGKGCSWKTFDHVSSPNSSLHRSGMLSPSESTYAPTSDDANRRHFGSAKEVTIGGMATKPTSELPREAYPTDRSEITDTKDKKKKHRKVRLITSRNFHLHSTCRSRCSGKRFMLVE